jgi:hypothetical protein
MLRNRVNMHMKLSGELAQVQFKPAANRAKPQCDQHLSKNSKNKSSKKNAENNQKKRIEALSTRL